MTKRLMILWIWVRMKLMRLSLWLYRYEHTRTPVQDGYQLEQVLRVVHDYALHSKPPKEMFHQLGKILYISHGMKIPQVFIDKVTMHYHAIRDGMCGCHICREWLDTIKARETLNTSH